jgi:Zn-dependent peptidase ImmA (M78 family)
LNNDDSIKKRSGYARESARSLLKEFFRNYPPVRYPVPVEEIVQYLGFELHLLDNLDENHRAIKLELLDEDRKLIGLNAKYHIHNRRFSMGHEIGHHVLAHPSESDCSDEEIKTYNQEADEFAGELLIPLEELKRRMKLNKDVKSLAKEFLVSEQALWIKIQNQNLLNLL